jgi:hypothetical protein
MAHPLFCEVLPVAVDPVPGMTVFSAAVVVVHVTVLVPAPADSSSLRIVASPENAWSSAVVDS